MKQLKKILQVLLPLMAAVFLFWMVYKDWDFSALADAFRRKVHYEWFLVSLFLSVLSMVLRGLRWQQLLEPVCPGSRTAVVSLSVFIGYAANLLLPRAGEVARCGVLSKKEGLSFSKALGTVIAERIFDVLVLLLITLGTLAFEAGMLRDFFSKNPDATQKVLLLIKSPLLWGGGVVMILCFLLFRKRIMKTSFYARVQALLERVWEGMRSILAIRKPWLFVLYTLGIWSCYFAMFVLVKSFFDWDCTAGTMALLSAFVMGSFGVVAPVQGGIGAYHFMVIYTLVFFGMTTQDAGIYALVAHGLQTFITLLSGLVAYIWLSAVKERVCV